MNAKNITTGTVHAATTDKNGHIIQDCGIRANQTASLVETDAAVTCRKCPTAAPKAPTAAKPATKSAGPAIWLVINPATGNAFCSRDTKKEATAAAERIGNGAYVRKG